MTFPASGAISASDINTQFTRTTGTAVSLADPAIRSVGSNDGVGTPFSYSNLYSKSPKWLYSGYTTQQDQATVTSTCAAIASGNGGSFVSQFSNTNSSLSFLTRCYLNGDIIYRATLPVFTTPHWLNSDSSGNIYGFYANALIKFNYNLTVPATGSTVLWTYNGDANQNSYRGGSSNASGIAPNGVFYMFNAFNASYPRASIILKTNTSWQHLWSRSLDRPDTSWDQPPYTRQMSHDNNDNSYVHSILRLSSDGTIALGFTKINASGTVQFSKRFARATPQACYFTRIDTNSAGTQVVISGNYDATTPSRVSGAVVASLNPSTGDIAWLKAFYISVPSDSAYNDAATAAVVDDSTGDIYLAMYVQEITAGGLWGYGGVNVLKLNSSGTLLWQRKWQAAGTTVAGNQAGCGNPNLAFANGVLRLSFQYGILGDYGMEPIGSQVFQVPLDGSGIGTYNPYNNTARLLRYTTASLIEVVPTTPSSGAGPVVSSATSTLSVEPYAVTTPNALPRGLINI